MTSIWAVLSYKQTPIEEESVTGLLVCGWNVSLVAAGAFLFILQWIPGPAERGEEREREMRTWSAFVYLPSTEDIQQRSDLVCQPFVHLYLQTDLQRSNPLALIFCIRSWWSSGHCTGLILQAKVMIFFCYWLWIALDRIKPRVSDKASVYNNGQTRGNQCTSESIRLLLWL